MEPLALLFGSEASVDSSPFRGDNNNTARRVPHSPNPQISSQIHSGTLVIALQWTGKRIKGFLAPSCRLLDDFRENSGPIRSPEHKRGIDYSSDAALFAAQKEEAQSGLERGGHLDF